MANHKSAAKRVLQAEKRNIRNRAVRSEVSTITKKAVAAVAGPEAVTAARSAEGMIARAAQRGVMHRKTAARKISRLMRRINTETKARTSK